MRKDKNMAARDKFATDYTNLGKPTTPARKPVAPAPDPKDGKTGKPSAPAPKGKPGVMARATARAIGDQDHLLPETHRRHFVTSTSTRGTATMVTNVSTVTRNTIGTRGRTRMARKVVGDLHRQGDLRPLEEERQSLLWMGQRRLQAWGQMQVQTRPQHEGEESSPRSQVSSCQSHACIDP